MIIKKYAQPYYNVHAIGHKKTGSKGALKKKILFVVFVVGFYEETMELQLRIRKNIYILKIILLCKSFLLEK